MPSLKDLRNRIASVQSTQKITSAMKMVAASKLKRAQASAEEGRPYGERMERMLAQMVASMSSLQSAPKLLSGHGTDNSYLIVAVTGDRGLCGGFNSSIVRETRRRITALEGEGKQVKLLCVGRKGRDVLRRDHAGRIVDSMENVTRSGAQFAPARDIAKRLRNMFEAGEFDTCIVIYNTFKSAISQEVTVKQIIPFPVEQLAAGGKDRVAASEAEYELEPGEDQLLGSLLPANLSMQIFRALLESYASEQGARMTAMENATNNAADMIDKLRLKYNRTRQAAITTELIEIISGAEAL
ncbi:MAG: F0F1 ATP synthase subunit gamma [Rhodospirillales bacterium]|nr:F0F1 ATP synthase subunit gamma [Rhodospirillales bacterium]